MNPNEQSKAEIYVQTKAWRYRVADDQLLLEICPVSQCTNSHFYMHRGGPKDGLWDCKKCGKSGNLWQLKEELGDNEVERIASQKNWAERDKKPDPLPNVPKCHEQLLADDDAMEYLLSTRGLKLAVIKDRKLGMMTQQGKKWLVIPYFAKDTIIFAKYRRLPPILESESRFAAPKGHEAPLYNEDILTAGVEEVIFVEGEMDALSCISEGIPYVLGVPGANSKKYEWVLRLDNAKPKRIYTLYDNDKVGQEAAAEMAKRVMLNTQLPPVQNILLPRFEKEDGTPGKDVNEWFKAGHTRLEFNELKQNAAPFEVRGVQSATEALDDMEQELEGKELLEPSYVYPWADLNRKAGGWERGDLIDILAEEKIGKTTMALNIADWIVSKYEENVLFWCLEMPNKRMVRKFVSLITRTDDSPAKSVEEAKEKMVAMRLAIPAAKNIISERKGELFLCDYQPHNSDEVFDVIRQAVRRYGVTHFVFDNIQALADTTLKRQDQRTIHISQISKRFKRVAVELGITGFRIVQPKKIREGEIASHRDADGSSQLSKDCDATITLHRSQLNKIKAEEFEETGFLDEEIAFDPRVLTRVSISRYAPGGVCTLMFNGGISEVRELTPEEHKAVKRPEVGVNYANIPSVEA